MPYDPIRAAGLILRRRAGRKEWRWLLLRAASHGEWGFPKGHLDPGETPVQAALRECAEECGIAVLIVEGPEWELHYRIRDGREKLTSYFPAMTSTADVCLSAEHTAARWCSAEELRRLLPFDNLRALAAVAVRAAGA